jgi:hypothetical protein
MMTELEAIKKRMQRRARMQIVWGVLSLFCLPFSLWMVYTSLPYLLAPSPYAWKQAFYMIELAVNSVSVIAWLMVYWLMYKVVRAYYEFLEIYQKQKELEQL